MINKSGKTLTIFIVLIFILLISSTCIGFFLYHQEERARKTAQSDLDAARSSNDKLQVQLKDIQGQLALSQDKNKEADQKINNLLDEQDLNEGLRAALKKENAQLKEQITSVEQAKQKIKTDLDDSVSKLSQYQQLLKESESKGKELEDRLSNLVETNKTLSAKIDGLSAGTVPAVVVPEGKDKVELGKIVVKPPEGSSGHVLSVDTDAEFVVFSLGLKEGVKPDSVLSLYRGNQYLGDIRATRVQDEMAAADIMPPLTSRQVHKDDTVVLKP